MPAEQSMTDGIYIYEATERRVEMDERSSALLTNTALRLPGNGIDATSGKYRIPDISPGEIAALARGSWVDEEHSREASHFSARLRAGTRELVDGRSAARLEEAGWGVVFAEDCDPAVRDALAELLDHRQDQANLNEPLYREFWGKQGYRRGQTKAHFLVAQGAGPGAVDPRVVPYYLLLVGGPEEIPFRFQYQLDMRYAVGRISFETLDEYRRYAETVVAAETEPQHPLGDCQVALFGPHNPGDSGTELTSRILVEKLGSRLSAQENDNWKIRTFPGAEATKARLKSLLGGTDTPDVVLTATHGLWFPKDHPNQRRRQGALLCQEWPGPSWQGPVEPEWYLSADDIGEDADVAGLITFHFACYSGGTPHLDNFDFRPPRQRGVLTSHPFTGALPQSLLAHPRGGALAVVSHVDQAWLHSICWQRREWLGTFQQMLGRLLKGDPIGWAMEPFNQRYAELASDLRDHLEQEELGLVAERDDLSLADLWTATNDTRGFVVLGDPAVRLAAPVDRGTA